MRHCDVLVEQKGWNRKWAKRSSRAFFTIVISFAYGEAKNLKVKRRDWSAKEKNRVWRRKAEKTTIEIWKRFSWDEKQCWVWVRKTYAWEKR